MFYLYENGNYAYDIYESWLWNWLLTISNKIAMLLQQFLLAGVEIILKPSIVLLNCTFPLYCVMSTPQPELKMRFTNLKLYLNHQLCYWIIHSLCIMFCSHPNQNLKWDSIIVLLFLFYFYLFFFEMRNLYGNSTALYIYLPSVFHINSEDPMPPAPQPD